MSTKPKVTAADGVTEVFNIPGYPLMVRAVDFNAAMRPAAPTASEITAELIAALREMTEIAEKVDGWQSFPSEPIERAYAVLALAPVAGGVPAEPNRADFCIGKSCACDPGPCAELAMRPRAAPASPQSDAAQPASSSAPAVGGSCEGCNGHGMVGGLRQDGYHSEECPFCKGSGLAAPAGAAGQDAARYRAFFDCGLPITFLGVEYRSKAALDAAIDEHLAAQGDGGTTE